MNTFRDLLHRYATASGLDVDDREWLMLLELDPVRAAHTMTHLTILAAEDLTADLAAQALDALRVAADRADATPATSYSAAAQVAAFSERITAARGRAWTTWADLLLPLLRDAGVLHAPTGRAASARPPRSWAPGFVRLPGTDEAYPAQVATRRRRAGNPIVRFDADTCRRIAADLAAAPDQRLTPVILVDRDHPILVVGACDLEQAWRAHATLVHADTDGLYRLGEHRWPWRIDTTATGADGAYSRPRRYPHAPHPTRPGSRHTAAATSRAVRMRLVTTG